MTFIATTQHLTDPRQPARSAPTINNAGGGAFQLNDWRRLERFLILGSDQGSYYATAAQLTEDNASVLHRCIDDNGVRVVQTITSISEIGRAPKHNPVLFALAMASKRGNQATRVAAQRAVPRVCRTAAHLMAFAEHLQRFGGWGRGTRRAISHWYTQQTAQRLAYQLVKYPRRAGWSHRDLLRKCHAKPTSLDHQALFHWLTKRKVPNDPDGALQQVWAASQAAKAATSNAVVNLIHQHRLPREAIPTQFLNSPDVWEALLVDMPLGAMIRNLATMTRRGLLRPMSDATQTVINRLADHERLRRARIHPIGILSALKTYEAGHGQRGNHHWTPVREIIDALNTAFYQSFQFVEPTRKRTLLALDVSGSMGWSAVAGVPGLSPRVASAAMALVTASREPHYGIVGFTGSVRDNASLAVTKSLTELAISPKQRLADAVSVLENLPFGATDCALPMLWAIQRKIAVDCFVIYTDSETWAGNIQPIEALRRYREISGIAAKLVVVGMVSNGFSIADPNNDNMLDVVGFDTASPAVIADFCRGAT